MKSGSFHSLAFSGALLPLVLAIAVAGAIPSRHPDATWVRGRVTYNGQPVSEASIFFHPSGKPETDVTDAVITADGSFAIPLFEGRYEIFILTASRSRWSREERFPARFMNPAAPELSITIGDRIYRIEIDLRD